MPGKNASAVMGSAYGRMPLLGDPAPAGYGTTAPPVYLFPYDLGVPDPEMVRPPAMELGEYEYPPRPPPPLDPPPLPPLPPPPPFRFSRALYDSSGEASRAEISVLGDDEGGAAAMRELR